MKKYGMNNYLSRRFVISWTVGPVIRVSILWLKITMCGKNSKGCGKNEFLLFYRKKIEIFTHLSIVSTIIDYFGLFGLMLWCRDLI